MPTDAHRASCFLKRLLADQTTDELRERLRPKVHGPARRVPRDPHLKAEAVDRRWQALPAHAENRAPLLDPHTLDEMACYQNNIENFIGCVRLPVGVAGPLRVNGLFAQGDYSVPLATTEPALVASYSRGAQLISEAGGCTAIYMSDDNQRAALLDLLKARRSGSRLMFWNMMVPRPIPGDLTDRLRPLEQLACELHARDKGFFYQSLNVAEVR